MKSLTDKVDEEMTRQSSRASSLLFSNVTLFPEMFDAIIDYGVIGRAIKSDLVALNCINPRDFTEDRHRKVDDRPYGGGPGMLMKVEPLEKSIAAAKACGTKETLATKVIYLSPQGRKLDHALAKELSKEKHLILLSGRYEGIDQRLIDKNVDMEISIGDYVLSGGELAAMVLIDVVTRLLPDVLGHASSALEDSFEDGLLDHPQYTRPERYQDVDVPAVLLSGDHQKIANWRLQQRLGKTWLNRPELIEQRSLSADEKSLLREFVDAHNEK